MSAPPNNQASVPSFDATMDKVFKGLEKLGSLPIFSASVNRIRFMSSSDETEVMELANEIMKDANLTTKLLRVTNSSQYNVTGNKISSISRAIVMLGYETVKSITMALKVIDSFNYDDTDIDINSLLAKSFMSAGFVKDMAVKTGLKDPEESYLCALLHNLGEIIVATILTEEYKQIMGLMKKENISWEKAQKRVLDCTLNDVAQAVFKKWEFPDTVIRTVEPYNKKDDGPVKNKHQLNRALASMSNTIIGSIYSPETGTGKDYKELLSELSEASGLETDSISSSLVDSFKVSCDMAEEYGLSKNALKPRVSNMESGDAARDKVIRSLSFLASGKKIPVEPPVNEDKNGQQQEAGVSGAEHAVVHNSYQEKVNSRNVEAMLSCLNEIGNSIIRKADINTIFGLVLDGISQGAGFDRAVLCFLSPDHKLYKARLGSGPGVDVLKEYFSFPVNIKTDLFSKVALDGDEVLVTDISNEKWQNMILQDYEEKTGSRSFVVASLQLGGKPVGFFYADMGVSNAEISMEHFNGFVQFISQAKLALLAR